jgi:hypothetical protein
LVAFGIAAASAPTLICVAAILLGSCVQTAPNGDDIGSQENVDRITSRESAAFDRYDIEELNCDHTYLDPIKEMQAPYRQMWAHGLGSMRLMEDENAQTDKQLDALDQCHVEAEARLKTQLWGNIVEVNSSNAQTPPNWSKISSQNYYAITRYRSEAKACSHRYLDPVGKAMAEGPQPKKAGDEAFNWQGQILEEALGKVGKCQIEAAATLKAQLQSP